MGDAAQMEAAIAAMNPTLCQDEYGNPLIVLREQARKKRVVGLEAHKQNILAARAVAETVRTSLGPKGMDKCIVDGTGE